MGQSGRRGRDIKQPRALCRKWRNILYFSVSSSSSVPWPSPLLSTGSKEMNFGQNVGLRWTRMVSMVTPSPAGLETFTQQNAVAPEMDTNGFYGDTFSSGFGDFYTAKRGLPIPHER